MYENIAGEEAFYRKNHDVTIMTSSGHVTSSGACPNDSLWALSYRLSIGTITLSGFVSEIYLASNCDKYYYVMTSSLTNDVIRPESTIREDHREHCRRRSIMTSWGHVTSSGASPIDSPWTLSYYRILFTLQQL